MTRKQRRLTLIGMAGIVLAAASALVLFALNDEIVFFYSPTDLAGKPVAAGTRVRVGGLVVDGSVAKGPDGSVDFAVTDTNTALQVSYAGILPDLFREGQGVIAEGVLDPDGRVRADNVLAKHDERYMPKEVADALKAQGEWRPEEAATQ